MTNDEMLSLAFETLGKSKDSRIWSWDICNKDFTDAYPEWHSGGEKEELTDRLARSLAVFLSSWGMYRGSGDLLDRNYLQYKPLISTLMDKQYWENEKGRDAMKVLYGELKRVLGIGSSLACQKIISGVFGACVPLDEINKKGIRKWNISSLKPDTIGTIVLSDPFSDSMAKVIDSLMLHQPEVDLKKYPFSEQPIYPKQRVVDLYFFWIGSAVSALEWIKKYEPRPSDAFLKGPLRKKLNELCGFYSSSSLSLNDLRTAVYASLPEELLSTFAGCNGAH